MALSSVAPIRPDPSLLVPQYALEAEDLLALARSEKEAVKYRMGKAYCLLLKANVTDMGGDSTRTCIGQLLEKLGIHTLNLCTE